MRKRLLEGVKICDFCWVWVGPMTTKTLADQGAQVIKIEGKSRPDVWRVSPPFKDNIVGYNRGGIFNIINSSKKSITLNLSKPKGIEIAKKLVAWADVVTENFAGGAMEKMGLSYAELKRIKPDIIMLSAAMMGQTGPYTNMPGFGAQLTALSGFTHVAGWPDREPADLGHYTDFIAPRYNALAILAALDYRRRTGKGVHLDMAQFEGCVNFIAPLILDYTVNGRVAGRMGNRSTHASPHGAFRCRGEERWCVVAALNDEEWQSFCKIIGNPDWTKEPRFNTLLGRKENEDEMERLIETWSVNHPPERVMTIMQAAGVNAGVVQDSEDLIDRDLHLKERNYYPEIEPAEMGKYFTIAPPYKLSKVSHDIHPAPLMGEHNEYVFKEILGMSDEEIGDLVAEGVVE
ncbi:MAG: CoA transferase [Dehalococcoidia bacterium]|nr:CoA transferase [Dehalococcoidia bacterium]